MIARDHTRKRRWLGANEIERYIQRYLFLYVHSINNECNSEKQRGERSIEVPRDHAEAESYRA